MPLRHSVYRRENVMHRSLAGLIAMSLMGQNPGPRIALDRFERVKEPVKKSRGFKKNLRKTQKKKR